MLKIMNILRERVWQQWHLKYQKIHAGIDTTAETIYGNQQEYSKLVFFQFPDSIFFFLNFSPHYFPVGFHHGDCFSFIALDFHRLNSTRISINFVSFQVFIVNKFLCRFRYLLQINFKTHHRIRWKWPFAHFQYAVGQGIDA